MRHLRRLPQGFTLVELVLVITVLGIVSFFAAARMTQRADSDAHGFAQQVTSTLRYAHKAAIAQRRLVYVNIDAGARRVRVCLDAATACAQPLAAPGGGYVDVTGNSTVTFASGTTQFSFDGLGRPSIGADLTLTVSGGAQTQSIVVERESGYVRRA
jgi:MSHA pilin protein MshC